MSNVNSVINEMRDKLKELVGDNSAHIKNFEREVFTSLQPNLGVATDATLAMILLQSYINNGILKEILEELKKSNEVKVEEVKAPAKK